MSRPRWLDGDPGRAVLGLLACQVTALLVLALLGGAPQRPSSASGVAHRELVRELQLTDLALWSEASYCRHLSQTDLFAPFADHPAAFEHFPSGSLVPVPVAARRNGPQLSGAEP